MPVSIGYPCTRGRNFEDVAGIITRTLNNVGDPFDDRGSFGCNTHAVERRVLSRITDMWNVRDRYWGYVTNSGTEGNLQGLFAAREKFPDAVLYVSEAAHYSVFKAARMLRMDARKVPADERGMMDLDRLALDAAGHELPIIACVTIGTTMTGAIDDPDAVFDALGRSADRVHVHADAAFFGAFLPLLPVNPVSLRRVNSMSISGHKYPGVPFPCGVYVSEDVPPFESYVEYIDQRDCTITGSRNGHAAVFLDRALDLMNSKEVLECLDNAEYLVGVLQKVAPWTQPWKNPHSPIVVLRGVPLPIAKAWELASERGTSHVVCCPHVTKDVLNDFASDLVRSASEMFAAVYVVATMLRVFFTIFRT